MFDKLSNETLATLVAEFLNPETCDTGIRSYSLGEYNDKVLEVLWKHALNLSSQAIKNLLLLNFSKEELLEILYNYEKETNNL